jgi:hypothetical protein
MSNVRQQVYEQQREQKLEDLASVMRDLAGTKPQEEERRLNTRMEQLLKDIDELDEKIKDCQREANLNEESDRH